MNKLFYILSPSFLVAVIMEIGFFAMFDPDKLYLFDQPLELSSIAIYSIGFLAFWAMGAAACYVMSVLQRSGADVNRGVSHHAMPHGHYGSH